MPSGTIAEVCPNSDYQGNTISVNRNLQDEASCVQYCVNTNGCVLGIWDKTYKACHIKAAGQVTWVAGGNQFNAIRVIATPPAQPVTKGYKACPRQTTSWTMDDGSVYEVCPNSDLSGQAYSVIGNVLSAWDCLRLCNLDTGCTYAVFDHQYFYCHLKGTTDATWGDNNQFDVVRLTKRGSRTAAPYTGTGRWANPVVVPANPVGAFVVPRTARILAFSSWGDNDYRGAEGMTQFTDWDYNSGVVSRRTVANTKHDMFCPGISVLGDGRLVVTGGSDAPRTSIYNPTTNAFSSGADMNIARGYQTSATLSNGKVFTLGGSYSGGEGGKLGETYDAGSNTWTKLTGCDPAPAYDSDGNTNNRDDHMWLYGWKSGSVFQAGPSTKQNWYGTANNGNTSYSSTRGTNDQMCGLHAMYDAVNGKIWSGGGAIHYNEVNGLTDAHITTLGAPYQAASVQQVAPLLRARAFANVVILPDGTMIVTGGQTYAKQFDDAGSQFIADMYNPYTNTWTALAPSKTARNYHSTSLLLADGRVFTGGGGLCWTAQGVSDAGCPRAGDHPSIEIFSPPYLFNADGSYANRPNVNSVSASSDNSGASARASDTVTVVMGDNASGVKFSLMRTGSATHSVNSDQRRVPLTATQNGGTWTMKLPTDYGVIIPGYYYLFAINSAGVPSVSVTVQIKL